MTSRTVIVVAFHFPPMSVSSGMHRTLSYVRALLERGWQPLVLTAHRRAYETADERHLPQIPEGAIVERAFALDAARHLSLAGKYPGWLAQPDRWRSWWLGAVPLGLRLARRHRPAALWSTYPIATAHLIGATLARLTRLPWIADFRDPMAHEGYPEDARTWQSFARVERKVFSRAAGAVFVTRGAQEMYRGRFPGFPEDRMRVIENGFDESAFAAAERDLPAPNPLSRAPLTLLHSGVVYPQWRNPQALFAALARLRSRGQLPEAGLRVRFRGSGHEPFIAALAREHGVSDLVELAPAIPYREALREMLLADALLVLQSEGCNDQIPAKLYEYFRARRPVIGLTDPAGETARAMRAAGLEAIFPLGDVQAIERGLAAFLSDLAAGRARAARDDAVGACARQARAAKMVDFLEAVCA